MLSPNTIILFGVVIGLVIGSFLAALVSPAAGFAFALPIGFWVLYRTVEETHRKR